MSTKSAACPKCGVESPAGTRYCTACGAALYIEELVPPTPLRSLAGCLLILGAGLFGSVGACFAMLTRAPGAGEAGAGYLTTALGMAAVTLLLLGLGVKLLMSRTVRRPPY